MAHPAPKFVGFAELRSPEDLLRKLQHDMYRMTQDEADVYATFDFFVTAEHMLDWIHPNKDGKAMREAMRQEHLLLQITSHIANGAKHFVAGAKQHKSVSAIESPQYVADGRDDSGSLETPIVVKLSAEEAILYGSSEVEAIVLAYQVLDFWQKRLEESDA